MVIGKSLLATTTLVRRIYFKKEAGVRLSYTVLGLAFEPILAPAIGWTFFTEQLSTTNILSIIAHHDDDFILMMSAIRRAKRSISSNL